jgi:hypothetical protein
LVSDTTVQMRKLRHTEARELTKAKHKLKSGPSPCPKPLYYIAFSTLHRLPAHHCQLDTLIEHISVCKTPE